MDKSSFLDMEITELPVVAAGLLEDMFGAFYNELWSQVFKLYDYGRR
jgi:hypothetical protein